MNDLDFFAGLSITGTVLGVDHTDDLATVQGVLGHGHFRRQHEPAGSGYQHANTDYGLIDFGWGRERPGGQWEVLYCGTQNHRLTGLSRRPRRRTAGLELRRRFGRFREQLHIGDLRAAVVARGFTMDSSAQWAGAGFSVHWVPGVATSALVVDSEEEESWGPPGTVVKMLGSAGGDRNGYAKARLRFGDQEKTFSSYAKHLLDLSDGERAAWLAKREPEEDRVLWWRYLRMSITLGGPDEPLARKRLRVALDLDAADRGIDVPGEAEAGVISSLIAHPEIARDFLSLDGLVKRWLATAPTLDEGRRLAAAATLDPVEIALSRRLRDQTHELRTAPEYLTEPDLADELRTWIAVGSQLLRQPTLFTSVSRSA